MRVLFAALSATVLLSACAPTTSRTAMAPQAAATPTAENYVWARNDGRRMAENPELLRQGQADQATCRATASSGGTLNLATFTSCMESRGYSRRQV
ncbi:MAG: hypothetical protein JWN07_2965 [Hyphomicrobiales bacterium]|nr:hypothetical protein [Hyphomicrobiales bacterium]